MKPIKSIKAHKIYVLLLIEKLGTIILVGVSKNLAERAYKKPNLQLTIPPLIKNKKNKHTISGG